MTKPGSGRLLALLRHAAGISIVLTPLAACIVAGSVHASLWLDEVSYWYYERSPSLRALEMRRPGSAIAPLFLNYFYCDIQRAVHWIMNGVGLTLHADPELHLRFLSILSFAAAGVLVYVRTFRQSGIWWWSVAAALALSASPLLLFHAFEARVSAFATLGVIVFLTMLAAALQRPRPRSFLLAGALLGIFLGHLHVWIVCLFAGLCVAAILRYLISRQRAELWTVAAFALPGAILATAEAAFIMSTYPPGGHGFPLHLPRPLGVLLDRTLAGTVSTAMSTPPAFFRPFWYSLSIPLVLLAAAIVLVLLNVRRSALVVFPLAAVLALLISAEVGAHVGYLIAPRYQVPLIGALLFTLSFAASRPARLIVALFAAIELTLVPTAIRDTEAKANGKQIAALIESEAPRERTAIVVQQGLRLGYPDPLHTFVVHFYIDDLHRDATPVHLFELPTLRDTTSTQGLRDYFGGGPELAERYASRPEAEWLAWLRASPFNQIWLVTPVPRMKAEDDQSVAFRAALAKSGFTLDTRHTYLVSGYPMTQVGLFVRR